MPSGEYPKLLVEFVGGEGAKISFVGPVSRQKYGRIKSGSRIWILREDLTDENRSKFKVLSDDRQQLRDLPRTPTDLLPAIPIQIAEKQGFGDDWWDTPANDPEQQFAELIVDEGQPADSLRRCPGCGKELPEDFDKRRKYCLECRPKA